MNDKQMQIEELSKEICNGCKTRHKCENNDGFCIMSDVVAEHLLNKDYGNIKDYQAEIDRLSTELAHREEDLIHADENVFYRECNVKLHEDEIKKQAVKEFVDFLQDYARQVQDYGYEGIGVNDIAEKAKEFLGNE